MGDEIHHANVIEVVYDFPQNAWKASIGSDEYGRPEAWGMTPVGAVTVLLYILGENWSFDPTWKPRQNV